MRLFTAWTTRRLAAEPRPIAVPRLNLGTTAPIAPAQAPRCDGSLALTELRDGDCRFPLGVFPFTFCGQRQTEGRSYCATHYAMTHHPARKTWE